MGYEYDIDRSAMEEIATTVMDDKALKQHVKAITHAAKATPITTSAFTRPSHLSHPRILGVLNLLRCEASRQRKATASAGFWFLCSHMAFPAPVHSHNYVSKPFGGIGILIISYETHSEAGMSKLIAMHAFRRGSSPLTGSGRISWPPAFDPMTCTRPWSIRGACFATTVRPSTGRAHGG